MSYDSVFRPASSSGAQARGVQAGMQAGMQAGLQAGVQAAASAGAPLDQDQGQLLKDEHDERAGGKAGAEAELELEMGGVWDSVSRDSLKSPSLRREPRRRTSRMVYDARGELVPASPASHGAQAKAHPRHRHRSSDDLHRVSLPLPRTLALAF